MQKLEKTKKLGDHLKDGNKRMIYPQMGGMGLNLTDYTMFEVYADSEKQLEISRKIEGAFPTDFTYPVDFGTVFVHDFGIPLLKPDYDFPSSLENPIKTMEALEKLKEISDRIFRETSNQAAGEMPGQIFRETSGQIAGEMPDQILRETSNQAARESSGQMPGESFEKTRETLFQGAVLMPVYLNSIQKIAGAIAKPEMVAVPGPFTLGSELVGVTDMARFTIKNPEFVESVLDFTTEIICKFIAQAIDRGAALIQISEPTAVILSPAMFAKWITPHLDKVFACINSRAWSALHICGDTTQYLGEMISVSPMVLSLDQRMNMGAASKQVPDSIILAGNVDPIGVMLQGTPWQVERAVETLLREMEGRENFMPSFGCDCPVETPTENMRAFVNAVYQWKS